MFIIIIIIFQITARKPKLSSTFLRPQKFTFTEPKPPIPHPSPTNLPPIPAISTPPSSSSSPLPTVIARSVPCPPSFCRIDKLSCCQLLLLLLLLLPAVLCRRSPRPSFGSVWIVEFRQADRELLLMSCRVLRVSGKELDSRTVTNPECFADKKSRRLPPRPRPEASVGAVLSSNAAAVGRGSVSTVASTAAWGKEPLLRKDGRRKVEYEPSVSSRRLFAVGSGYFGLESLYLLIGLTVSLLILPLVLPPLPPPPFMLLLLPICILACLMILAFMPSYVRDLTYM